MHINAVISYLNAWTRLNQSQANELEEVIASLNDVGIEDLRQKLRDDEKSGRGRQIYPRQSISARDLGQAITTQLTELGWGTNTFLTHVPKQRRLGKIDFVKNAVGVEISLGKSAFVESALFVRFPTFVRTGIFQIAVVLLPMEDLAKEMVLGVQSFEYLRDLMIDMYPIPVQYPFAVIGFSHNETDLEILELTSEIDNYLLEHIGLSLEQMVVLNEGPSYDFKKSLPDNKKLAQEICAFANAEDGGLILMGIDDDGISVGLPADLSLDDLQLQITNIANDSCSPVPRFDMKIFDSPLNPASKILIVRIHDLERKPCMVGSRVYVRSGPSVRAADSEEIRRLVLSSAT